MGNGQGGDADGKGLGEGNAGHGDSDTGHAGQKGNDRDADAKASDRDSKTGKSGALQGSLNAAHASPTALSHAAPNSRVGQLAAYAAAVKAGNLSAAAQALANASNMSLSSQSVQAVNAKLGISMSANQAASMATAANALQGNDRNGSE